MKITLKQFTSKYYLEKCTHPKGIDGQCVCLIRCYLDEVLGFPQFRTVQGAVDIWNRMVMGNEYIKIPNRWWTIPKKGDIFIMDRSSKNRYGHTGIILKANVLRFESFDSNFSRKLKAYVEYHNYTYPRVLGFFRPKLPVKPIMDRVNEALRETGDVPSRSVGTLNLSRWWQKRVARSKRKFTDDDKGYRALVGAITWHQRHKRYPHDN